MSEPESSTSLSPGELARIAAKDRLTAIENGPDTVAAGLATHLKHIMLDGHNRICFIDSRNLADRIFMDPAYADSKVYYWFLMNDSEASSDEELLEEYATLREVMSEMGNPEDLSYEQFLSITNNGPTTHTNHFTLLVRCADRTFFLDPVGFLSSDIQPGLRELTDADGAQAITHDTRFYQMVSITPITPDESQRAPDPVFWDDRQPFTTVGEL